MPFREKHAGSWFWILSTIVIVLGFAIVLGFLPGKEMAVTADERDRMELGSKQ